jgi:ribonuclease G
MQITRQRLRPELNISTAEECPACHGTGKIGPSILISDEIENNLRYLVSQGHRNLKLHVNPIVEAYLTKGTFFKTSIIKNWMKQIKVKLTLVIDNNASIVQYDFYDAKTDELIKL